MKRLVTVEWYRRQALLFAVVFIAAGNVLALAAVYVLLQRADSAHSAICALEQDYVRRQHTSEQFLKAHPHGAFGFSRAQIEQQLSLQRRTIEVLRVADC